jgi:hypothetical protein
LPTESAPVRAAVRSATSCFMASVTACSIVILRH